MAEGTKPNILIIDDDKFLLDMYTLKFSESGFEATSAFGSTDAVEKLKNNEIEPDIILLDIVMPTMDGFEFLEKIKEENLAPGAEVIILSNLGQQDDIKKGKELGAAGYIVKANATPSEVVTRAKEITGLGGDAEEA